MAVVNGQEAAQAGKILGNFWDFWLASAYALILGILLGLYIGLPG